MSANYLPRTRPIIPVGYRTWLAVSRVKDRGATYRDGTVDERIEWLLEAITRPGADIHQRHDDLVTLAELVIATRGKRIVLARSRDGRPSAFTYDGTENFGYGVPRIDSDTHDVDCAVCGDATIYNTNGHDADFDGHPYTLRKD